MLLFQITRNGKNKSFYRKPAVVTIVDMITKLCRHASWVALRIHAACEPPETRSHSRRFNEVQPHESSGQAVPSRVEPVGTARWHHVFASPVNNEAGLIRKQSEMTQTLMSLLWSCSCNQMLIQFYVRLSFVSFLLGFGVRRQCDTVCFCLKETETHKNEEATGCQRRTFKLLQTLTTSVLAFVSPSYFPLSPSSACLIQQLFQHTAASRHNKAKKGNPTTCRGATFCRHHQ